MKKLNIGVDIDGTITDPYHFIPYLNEMFNKNYKNEDITTHDWEALYNIKESDIITNFHETYLHTYIDVECIEGSSEIIEEIAKEHNVFFITARSHNLTDITNNWLKEIGLSSIDVHLLGSHYKVEKAQELNCDIFIEDSPANAIQLAEVGIIVFLINTYYNQEVKHPNIIRVNNWNEIKEKINTIDIV
jgi:uncharacterized HAD superfamily protein